MSLQRIYNRLRYPMDIAIAGVFGVIVGILLGFMLLVSL